MLKFFSLSCKEATRLSEKKISLDKLSLWESFQLRLHLKICDHCRRYAAQSAVIDAALKRQLEGQAEDVVYGEPPAIPDDFEERLLHRLNSKEEK